MKNLNELANTLTKGTISQFKKFGKEDLLDGINLLCVFNSVILRYCKNMEYTNAYDICIQSWETAFVKEAQKNIIGLKFMDSGGQIASYIKKLFTCRVLNEIAKCNVENRKHREIASLNALFDSNPNRGEVLESPYIKDSDFMDLITNGNTSENVDFFSCLDKALPRLSLNDKTILSGILGGMSLNEINSAVGFDCSDIFKKIQGMLMDIYKEYQGKHLPKFQSNSKSITKDERLGKQLSQCVNVFLNA